MTTTPSVTSGFRLAARLHLLVVGVWLVSVVLLLPAQVIVQATTGPDRANLPAGGLDAGEDLIVFFDIMRPLAVPLAVALVFGYLLFLGWWVLWHAGTVRWWLDPEADAVRLASILGEGLAVWWRYARFVLLALLLQAIAATTPWLPLLLDIEQRFLLPLLIFGSVVSILTTTLVWLATLRGAWLLGEPDRRSAVAAWGRGLWAVLRQPLRSLLPFLVWALSGLALLMLPLLYDGPAAAVFLLVAWLVSAFCWVALHLSYAPPKPKPARSVSPLDPPGPSYVTTRFPTLLRDESERGTSNQ
jgi:hypothetical protein